MGSVHVFRGEHNSDIICAHVLDTMNRKKKRTNLFAALNERILAVIDKRSGTSRLLQAELEDRQLLLKYADGPMRRIAWLRLLRVVAIRRDLYAGDEVSVLLEFADAGLIEVPASCQGWSDICAAFEKLDGAPPFGNWHSEVILAPIGQAINVWSRGS